MIHPNLYIKRTKKKGRGVFTSKELRKGTTIEVSPVIVMSNKDRKLIDETLLHDYIFEWGGQKKQCCMAVGYVSMYNHSYESNCEYEMDYNEETISIITMRSIKAGEELSINYNGSYNNDEPVWFDKKAKKKADK